VSGPSPLPEAAREFALPGPFPVGRYAARLRDQLRSFTRVQLSGEISGLRPPTRTRAYFELRDADGAIPCSMWRDDWERLGELTGSLADGVAVVVAGGCDYYPGSASASPAFSFSVKDLRIAGEGDLLAQIAQRRRALAADGLLELQGALPRAILPRTIGVVCGEGAKAGDDLLAAFARRGWRGRIVWAFAPVQDRHAASRIATALRDLAASGQVDVIVVARGGGSLTDLLAFSDETLCRTVALLAVPVIASIGHHTDRSLLDEVAAASCSTPTHAAEVAVPLDCNQARTALVGAARRLRRGGRSAVLRSRARRPSTFAANGFSCAAGPRSSRRRAAGNRARGKRACGARQSRCSDSPRGFCATRGSGARPSSSGSRWRCRRMTRSARWRAASRLSRTPPASLSRARRRPAARKR
jgi:exodeoxyribonuclease VII large subunit